MCQVSSQNLSWPFLTVSCKWPVIIVSVDRLHFVYFCFSLLFVSFVNLLFVTCYLLLSETDGKKVAFRFPSEEVDMLTLGMEKRV